MIVDLFQESGKSDSLDRDDVFDILSNFRRRIALEYLTQQSKPVLVGELVDEISAEEASMMDDEVSSKLRASVYAAVVQSHLPKLVEYGIIDYDDQHQIVEVTSEVEIIKDYLEPTSGTSRLWPVSYLMISSTAGAIAIGSGVGVPGLIDLDPATTLHFVIVLIFSVTVLQIVDTLR